MRQNRGGCDAVVGGGLGTTPEIPPCLIGAINPALYANLTESDQIQVYQTPAALPLIPMEALRHPFDPILRVSPHVFEQPDFPKFPFLAWQGFSRCRLSVATSASEWRPQCRN
ncbi:hypothetical protein WISP_91321 [Willisornis vidua]|uniref:Uncharacterized protein n=1 Tax=Willisornis vidua TaxID=1566151 RepID=A0ABQ9D1E7_9PASS|nr:hypothetical protein WISP_91321 [Willisornis vidua]